MPVEILFSLSRHIFRAGKMCQTEEHQKLTLNATWFHVCKKMFSISRPNVTQYCNPYTALTCVFNPALNKLQWKDHGGARPAPLPVVAWLWKGQDQVMQSKMQDIHILKYPRGEFFSLNSWADAWVLPGSLCTFHRGRNTRDCVLLSVPGPSPPDAGVCAFLQPHSTPDHRDSQWQKSLPLGKVISSSHF